MKYFVLILKVILAGFILLFALATFMGKAYTQTLSLLLLTVFIFYWPSTWSATPRKKKSMVIRIITLALLVAAQFTFFTPEPKKSIYISEAHKQELNNIYDQKVKDWPKDAEDIYIETDFGKVHILAVGDPQLPPILIFHAASMGAHSWAENIVSLSKFRIYAVDNIGEGNKSTLYDASVFPNSGKEIADLYATIADSLGISHSPVLGASNGGFIAMNYAYYHPQKVQSLILLGPMGLTPLTSRSILMLSIATMYPFQFVRNYVTSWALGEDEYCLQKYGDWFNCILKGTIPSVAKPSILTKEQKRKMNLPILLFLGTEDPIVGDAELAKLVAEDFPDIKIEILKSAHLISIEKREYVNDKIRHFLYTPII